MELETIEEAAENYAESTPDNDPVRINSFIAGAKWQQETHMDIKDNKIELLEEDLECIRMYLDDLKIPRTDKDDKEYSIVGRIKFQQERMYSDMQEYAEFCIRCYEKGIPCIIAKDWFEQFKKK